MLTHSKFLLSPNNLLVSPIRGHKNNREQKKESKIALLEVAGEGIEPPAFGL